MSRRSSSRRSKRTNKPITPSVNWDRRQHPALQLTEAEKLLIGLLSVLLIALPWMVGGTPLWAHGVAAFLSVACLGSALLPRHGDSHSVTATGQWKRLILFPGFWFGVGLMAITGIQAMNSAWSLEGTEGFRWVEESTHIRWLPAGISGSAGEPAALRGFLVITTATFALGAAWIGLTRRKSILWILALTTSNAAIIAIVGFVHLAGKHPRILGLFEPPTKVFLATFPHHWHGAAYMTILVAAATGLACHHGLQIGKSVRRANPSGLFIFTAIILTLSATYSYSRPAAGVAGALLTAFVCYRGYRFLAAEAALSRRVFLSFLSAAVIAGGAFCTGQFASTYVNKASASEDIENAISAPGTWAATSSVFWHMSRERPLFGWGWGSAPYFYESQGQKLDQGDLPPHLALEYSSNDWLRLLAEVGWAGFILFMALLIYLTRFLLSRGLGGHPVRLMLAAGALGGFLLVFSSPLLENTAFLTTWILLLGFGAILARIEKSRHRPLHISEI